MQRGNSERKKRKKKKKQVRQYPLLDFGCPHNRRGGGMGQRRLIFVSSTDAV